MKNVSSIQCQPHEHAAAILSWLADKDCALVEAQLAGLADDHPVHLAADAIADAADSDDNAIRSAGLSALFGSLVEPLNDSFTPAGRAVYGHVFSRMTWRIASRHRLLHQELARFGINTARSLLQKYQTSRRNTSAVTTNPITRILVLSRVTIGADILITSIALQRLHQRFPQAELVLCGDAKLDGLFSSLANVRIRPLSYARRGPLRERLMSWLTVLQAVESENPDLIISPDSRLDQLGVLPLVMDPARYWLWESLQGEQVPAQSLAELFDGWLARRLGLPPAPPVYPQIGLAAQPAANQLRLRAAWGRAPMVAVKLDHGGNPAKALPRAWEVAMLRALRTSGWRILLDRGFGAEELENSDALLRELGWQAFDIDDSGNGLGLPIDHLESGSLAKAELVRFHGSIAGWAGACALCGLAVSYDSVGHHLAAALEVPVVVAFTGFHSADFPIAWQPRGRASVRVVIVGTDEKRDDAAHAPALRRLLDVLPGAPTPR